MKNQPMNNCAANGNGVKCNEWFRKFSNSISRFVGSPWAFMLSILLIVGWMASGPLFHFSDTWQLVINTGTTIITFLMVFLIQNTQNRESKALHLKLDELIIAMKGARNKLVNLETLSDAELEKLEQEFHKMGNRRQQTRRNGNALEHKAAALNAGSVG